MQMACLEASIQAYSRVNKASRVKSRQETGKVSRWRALKAMLESLALILLAVASQPGGSEQGGAKSEQDFLEESTQGEN